MNRKLFFLRRLLPFFIVTVLAAGKIPVSAGELTSGEQLFEDNAEKEESSAHVSDELTSETEDTLLDAPEEDILTGEETEDEVRYIKGRPLTEEEREEQLAPMKNLQELPAVPDIKSDFRAVPEAGKSCGVSVKI